MLRLFVCVYCLSICFLWASQSHDWCDLAAPHPPHTHVFLEEMPLSPPVIFLLDYLFFLIVRWASCLYILEINSLSVVSFANIFSHSEGYLFNLCIVFFVVQKLLSLIRLPFFFFFFAFIFITLEDGGCEVLSMAIRGEKEIRGIQIWKDVNSHCLQPWYYT